MHLQGMPEMKLKVFRLNVYFIYRTWTSSDKLSLFSSNRRMNTTLQNSDEVSECVYKQMTYT